MTVSLEEARGAENAGAVHSICCSQNLRLSDPCTEYGTHQDSTILARGGSARTDPRSEVSIFPTHLDDRICNPCSDTGSSGSRWDRMLLVYSYTGPEHSHSRRVVLVSTSSRSRNGRLPSGDAPAPAWRVPRDTHDHASSRQQNHTTVSQRPSRCSPSHHTDRPHTLQQELAFTIHEHQGVRPPLCSPVHGAPRV